MIYHFPLENTYASLPDRFYARVPPTPVSAPKLIRLNRDLASDLRLDPDWLGSREGVEVLAGNAFPTGRHLSLKPTPGTNLGTSCLNLAMAVRSS